MSHVALHPDVLHDLRNLGFDGREEGFLLVGKFARELNGFYVTRMIPATQSWSATRTSTTFDSRRIASIAETLPASLSIIGMAHSHPPNETTVASSVDLKGAGSIARSVGRDWLEMIVSERQNDRGEWEATELSAYLVSENGSAELVEQTTRSERDLPNVPTATSWAVNLGADAEPRLEYNPRSGELEEA